MSDHTLEVRKFEGDVTDHQGVRMYVVDGKCSVAVDSPLALMTREQALIHAAWIVARCDASPNYVEFREILKAVLKA